MASIRRFTVRVVNLLAYWKLISRESKVTA